MPPGEVDGEVRARCRLEKQAVIDEGLEDLLRLIYTSAPRGSQDGLPVPGLFGRAIGGTVRQPQIANCPSLSRLTSARTRTWVKWSLDAGRSW